jgi:triacylglycerol esterase/lipase EstA (alpha/beta hydrolase family)
LTTLNLVHDAGSDACRHVIFFHGLCGNSAETWQSSADSSEFWPAWLASDLRNVSIWTVDYNAAASSWFKRKAMHLVDRSLNVLERIVVEPRLQTGELILVGHSLGGLIIKSLLRQAESQSYQRNNISNFIKRVRKIAFLATPHSGSSLASISNVFRIFFKPSLATRSLLNGDPNLRDLNNWYKGWSVKHGIENLALMETELLEWGPLKAIIVKPSSADPGLYTQAIPVDANHYTICKPDNRDSEIYILVKALINKDIESAHQETVLEKKLEYIDSKVDQLPKKTVELIAEKLPSINSMSGFPHELIDSRIEENLSVIRKSRFFVGFTVLEKVNRLANDIINGTLVGGSPTVKCHALAWCARLQSSNGDIKQAIISNQKAKELSDLEEICIAEAFILAAQDNTPKALASLMQQLSAQKYSAAFIIKNREDSEGSIQWMKDSGIKFSDLDSDGKIFYLDTLLNAQQWKLALESIEVIKNDEYLNSPALLHLSAMANLLQTVPLELRETVRRQIPFAGRNFPLFSDAKSLILRKKAIELLSQCETIARSLGCHDVANIASDYALWLKLFDPDSATDGMLELKKSMSNDSEIALRRFPMAFFFNVDIDLAAVEVEVDRQTARTDGGSTIASMARFVLALTKREPIEQLQYIDVHRQQINLCINKRELYRIEIETLTKCGLVQEAERYLSKIKGELAPPVQEELKAIIAASCNGEPLQIYIAQYQKTSEISDLINLVRFLEKTLHVKQFYEYSEILFNRANSVWSAEKFANAQSELGKYAALYDFLNRNTDLISQSKLLQLHWAWALFCKGRLTDCRKELVKLKNNGIDDINIRILEVNVAITSGDWESLLPYLDNEWNMREERTAKELLQVSQLAQALQPKRAVDFIMAAREKGSEDPNILAAAYFAATRMGWENEPDVCNWLNKAAELSDKNGPIQRVPVKELYPLIASRQEQNSKIMKALYDGNLPVFTAANLLNKTLSDFYLFPAIANSNEPDIRRRIPIYAFSAVRGEFPIQVDAIFIDSTALLTLGYLNILDVVFKAFKKIIVSHSTLGWLFGEKQRAAFHQPSKIEEAKNLLKMLSDGAVKVLPLDQVIDSELAFEIGDELVFLLQEASKINSENPRQKLVVRPYPVHKIGSFMNEIIDLKDHADKLCSCTAVVKKLRECGVLTEEEERNALQYLDQNETEWPFERIDIQDDAILYLDDLSVSYLQFTGALEKISSTNLQIYIHQSQVNRSKELRDYESVYITANKLLDSIRGPLTKAIESGKVELTEAPDRGNKRKSGEPFIQNEMFLAVQKCGAAVIDDPFINRRKALATESSSVPISTTLDLLNFLVNQEIITVNQKMACHTTLRQAGYIYVPLLQEDINYFLEKAKIDGVHLRETAELKSVRESLLLVRLSRLIQLPRDAIWLTNTFRNLSHCLKSQWVEENRESISIARSDWLLQLINYRGWAHCFNGKAGIGFAQSGAAMNINLLLRPPDKASPAIQIKYWLWLEKNVIEPLKNEDPVSYAWLLQSLKELISQCHETEEKKANDQKNDKRYYTENC